MIDAALNREQGREHGSCRKGRPSIGSMRGVVAVGLSMAFGALPGASEETSADGRGTALSLFASSGSAVVINGSRPIDMRSVGFRWSRRWRATGNRWLVGNPTLSVELIPWMEFEQEPAAWAPALNLLYEHRFAPTARWHPVLRAGGGVLYANREVPPDETRLNFSLLVGVGIDIDITRRIGIASEYRLHHVSNANTGPVNPSINAHTLVLGITFKPGVKTGPGV